jgi:hypothetical protein
MLVEAMLVKLDSPIRVRYDIDRIQASQLDAIAFSANAIDHQYRRLAWRLGRAGETALAEEYLPDAWTIVDWVYRMHELVDRLRGVERRSPGSEEYRSTSSLVEMHRHAIQHLKGTIPELEPGRAPWGHLCWSRRLPRTPEGERQWQGRILSGPVFGPEVELEFHMPPPRPPRRAVDHVSLYASDGKTEIGLTGQHEALVRFIPKLEAAAASGRRRPDGILVMRP